MNFGNLDVQDIKSAFNKVKAAVLNLSELEQKVRDATSSEAWGASSSLMQELAKATYDYQGFNEVMSATYKRFSQEGRTWRNIYKALTLIEYLIKNGSEKVIDYTRSHSYELKACLNYNFIDEKGKDQGINIRHRAKLILDLLQSDDMIRMERQKAAENKSKYGGVGSDGSRSGGFGNNTNSRYGGFGSSSSSSGYPGFAGESSFAPSSTSPITQSVAPNTPASTASNMSTKPVDIVQSKPAVIDLLGFDDLSAPVPNNQATKATSDEEWRDFASACNNSSPVLASTKVTPTPASGFDAVFSTVPLTQPSISSKHPTLLDDDFADFATAPAPASTKSPVMADFVNFSVPSTIPNIGIPNPLSSGPTSLMSSGTAPPYTQLSIAGINTATSVTPPFNIVPTSTVIMGGANMAQQQPKIATSTPLSQLIGSNLVDLDSLAMLGAKSTPSSGPSMNSMMATPMSTSMVSCMMPMAGSGVTSCNVGSQPASFIGQSIDITTQSQASSQSQVGAFNMGSLL